MMTMSGAMKTETLKPSPPSRRSGREWGDHHRYVDVFEIAINMIFPSTLIEALGGYNAEKWADAINKDLEFL